MLIKCEECNLQVSDKAPSCPHCGILIQSNIKPKVRKSNKRKRLPNGFGQISEIKGRNLRNPFRAMITVGKTETGRPICKPLKPESFFPTYNDAYAALVEYNKNPYDLSPSMTIGELYEKWTNEYFAKLQSDTSVRSIKSAWNYCTSIANMRVVEVRARHLKGCIDDGFIIFRDEKRFATPSQKMKIKSMFNMMFDYAVEYEMVDRNYARTFNLSANVTKESEANKKSHIPFSDEEMEILWANVDSTKYVDVILIQCYSGWRPQEMGLIELENVDLENWTFKGGSKTEAGIDRTVPIHSRIRPLVERKYKEALELKSKYLINCTDNFNSRSTIEFSYEKYRSRFTKILNELTLNLEHRPHDGRIHFVTYAKKYNVDEYAIKYIIGHAISDITEKVYTKRDVSWLAEEIEKIK